ncbi:MAG: aminodeoxychorismate synthase component I [Bryobacteraceae bacterium]
MRTLIIDNYDSFTYNLVDAVARVRQCAPMVVRNDELTWEQIQRLDFDSVIISPGPGRPENPRDFGVSAQVIAEANVPLLGVCLGHQGIAHQFGGSVIRAAEPVHGRSAQIIHDADELFAGIPERFSAIRYHSLVVGEPLPPELKKIARTADGVLMALRHVTRPIWGVQFHPESICTEYGIALLRNFLPPAHARASTIRTTVSPAPRRAIQVHARQIPLPAAPETIFRNLFSHERYAFWLDSSMVSDNSRFSFMGTGSEVLRGDVFSEMDRTLRDVEVQAPPLPFQFTGGYVGYLGYELKSECGSPNKHRSPLPDACLLQVDRFLAIDHRENTLWIVSCGDPDEETEKRLAAIKDCLPAISTSAPVEFELATERGEYLRLIDCCRSYIAAGESYEICLTNQLRVRTGVSPLAYYETLRKLNPAPHSAYLHFDDIDVACSSPERFLRIDTSGNVESRPIKGTIRRGNSREEDLELGASLAGSEKNRAENLMIVDLTRNDLGRVCLPGSVHVPQMMQVETYATVHQLVSTITGRLAPRKTAVDCIRAAFPGGSMTGAPKLRTLEILDGLEPEARGIYSGSIGYIGFNGTVDLNIVIRTAVFHQGVASIGVGGAIVYQSQPEDEWDEMLLKAQALLRAFSGKLS